MGEGTPTAICSWHKCPRAGARAASVEADATYEGPVSEPRRVVAPAAVREDFATWIAIAKPSTRIGRPLLDSGPDGDDPRPRDPQTWHHGLVAKWWSEFNHDGPEIAFFQRFIQNGGEPALDVGCGTGRLLLPYLRAGLDVDGCDVSADMLALCSEEAAREGLSPTLYEQAMHELDLPRAYKTIVVCGAFGLGSSRDQDLQALRRIHDHLEPGGTLLLDNEVPYADANAWRYWLKDGRSSLPESPEPSDSPRQASDGTEYRLSSRVVEIDPIDQRLTLEMHAEMWRDGELAAEEDHLLNLHMYFRDELLLMLERVGFDDVVVHGGYSEEAATSDHDFLVFVARKSPVDDCT